MSIASETCSSEAERRRFFTASCVALIATSCSFAVFSDIMQPLKEEFSLSNLDVGWIRGAQLWGFPLTILTFGPLCDILGMRFLLRLAFVLHLAGVVIVWLASGLEMLFAGALIIGMANGLVEAACNPLIATIYPNQKTRKLNQFHVWFPGGIVIGAVLGFLLTKYGIGTWHWKLAFILVPTLIYGVMFFGLKFPATERVQSGVTTGQMFRSTFSRPLFFLLLFCMMLSASVELGPNSWMGAVFTKNIPGIIILAWISGLMAILRQFAGPVVQKFSPTGLLFISSIVAGIGLWWLSYARTAPEAFASSAVFALGVCYFWPTMLGIVSERVPKGGALALALVGGLGAFTAGFITAPQMGKIVDELGHSKLDSKQTLQVLDQIIATYPSMAEQASKGRAQDIQQAITFTKIVRDKAIQSEGILPPIETANALRKAIDVGGDSPLKAEAQALLTPAENYGGRMAFRKVALLSIVLTLIFGGLFVRDALRGGYQTETLTPKQD